MAADSGYFLVKKDKEAVGKILSLIATRPGRNRPEFDRKEKVFHVKTNLIICPR